jgi:hypothetical protein
MNDLRRERKIPPPDACATSFLVCAPRLGRTLGAMTFMTIVGIDSINELERFFSWKICAALRRRVDRSSGFRRGIKA